MLLYRAGSATSKNLTPRAGVDTVALRGRPPGLSFYETAAAALGANSSGKVQALDPAGLPQGLRASEDDPAEGGTAGHFTIAPVDASGQIDQTRLDEWASRRDEPDADPLVEAVQRAIVEERKYP